MQKENDKQKCDCVNKVGFWIIDGDDWIIVDGRVRFSSQPDCKCYQPEKESYTP